MHGLSARKVPIVAHFRNTERRQLGPHSWNYSKSSRNDGPQGRACAIQMSLPHVAPDRSMMDRFIPAT
jgi:hypothetical protein